MRDHCYMNKLTESYEQLSMFESLTLMRPICSDFFQSFESGIANAISSSKWWKIIISMKKYTSLKCDY